MDEEDGGFSINTEYAARYNTWRQKEELQKLKDRYGDIESEEETTSSESEDDEAEALTDQLEKGWLKAYAAIKTKDPKIYSKEAKFYESDDEKGAEKGEIKKNKQKPLYLKDYERKVILEKGGHLSDEESDGEKEEDVYKGPSYYEEQAQIRQSIKAAIKDSDEDSDSELLQHRKKTKEEQDKEESDYLQWLKGQGEDAGTNIDPELSSLKRYWNQPDLDEGEKFLRDYILNKKYIDKDDEDRIPLYHEIVDGEDGVEEEDKELEKQEEFERKYNFRFEEPDAELIKSYPRTIEASVRRKDDKRAKKRQELKERKEHEKNRKKEEIKQLKNLKKQEIVDKLEKLKEITGNPTLGFSEKDIEADFDPAEYDKMMKHVFDEDYYREEEEETKPEFQSEEFLGVEENYDDWTRDQEDYAEEEHSAEPHCEDTDFIMDADYDPSQDFQRDKKKKKKKSKFVEAVLRKKPVYEPSDKTFEEYFDEYYKLDYEDIIGDTPCRFKYRQVVPNSFGLDTGEVLKARDKELNRWVSLKKTYQYRTEEEEKYDVKVYAKKGQNVQKKLSILTSLTEKNEGNKPAEIDNSSKGTSQQKKKQKKIKRGQGQKTSQGHETIEEQILKKSPKMEVETVDLSQQKSDMKRNKTGNKKDKNLERSSDNFAVSKDSELSQKEGHKRKQKNSDADEETETSQHKKQKIDSTLGDASGVTDSNTANRGSESKRKRKRKKKQSNASASQMLTQDSTKTLKKKKSKVKKNQMSDERLRAYGINPKKFKYMTIHKAKQTS